MNYLGNDIVSLSSEANRLSFGNVEYLKRAFNEEEIRTIQDLPHLPMAELIWSCKESSYKVLVKHGLRKSFSPGLYEVSINNKSIEHSSGKQWIIGHVLYGRELVYSASTYQDDYVHTICSMTPVDDSILCGVKKSDLHDPCKESRSTWDFALNRISDELKCSRESLTRHVDPVTGISSLSSSITQGKIDVSTSHDCGWLSFVCAI